MNGYPDSDSFLLYLTDPEHFPGKRGLLDMLTTGLYIGLPVVFTGLMGWAGISLARFLDRQMSAVQSPSIDAGNKSGETNSKVMKKIVS